jgi:tRNA dimethylallyltransferase
MLARGLLDEVRSLHQRGDLHAGLPAVRAVGYRQAWAYLAGEIDRSTFEARAVSATRQLAKRQLTWLRRGSVGERLNPDEQALSELIRVLVRAIRAAVDAA